MGPWEGRSVIRANLHISFDPGFEVFLKRKKSLVFTCPLKRNAPIIDIIESIGVPHTEIGRISAKGAELDFHFKPRSTMSVDVSPVQALCDVREKTLLRPVPYPDIRFIVDENVVKLAVFLRILGLDAIYHPGIHDGEIAAIARAQKRVVLSRDIQLFKRKNIVYGRYIRSINPLDQIKEIKDFFRFHEPFAPFTRCLECNTVLAPVSKESVIHRLEPKTKAYFNEFRLCPVCDKVFWRGSHHDHMMQALTSSGIL